jgi:hypothetical protein
MPSVNSNIRLVTLLVSAALWTASPVSARAQDPPDTEFEAAVMSDEEITCPPGFAAIYEDNVHGFFFGRSRLEQRQTDYDDPWHLGVVYTYSYTGETTNERMRVTGTHHVNKAQCLAATYYYLTGVPAQIARLHNATFTSIACADGGGSNPVAVTYDPYAESGPSDCDDSYGGGGGSGTYYNPGDSTGGETVDWGTGQGDGGSSACGVKAVVEYVCIDIYNEETQEWEEWSCGYATTC